MIDEIPTADDVAWAIVAAGRACGVEGYGLLGIPEGEPGYEMPRRAAFCALEICFPQCPKPILVRAVGAPRGFLSRFEPRVPKEERAQRVRAQHIAAEAIFRAREAREPLTMRRPAVLDALNVTANLMNDPPPGRSALANAGPWQPYEQRFKEGEDGPQRPST